MRIAVTISPGLSPIDRGSIEDAMLAALGSDAEFLGGGTLLGAVLRSDFTLSVPATRSIDDVAVICRKILEEVEFFDASTVTLQVGDQRFDVQTQVSQYTDS